MSFWIAATASASAALTVWVSAAGDRGVTAADASGVDGAGEPGYHAATHQTDNRGISVSVDPHALPLVDESFLGERTDAQH